jgi:hypothetical protein
MLERNTKKRSEEPKRIEESLKEVKGEEAECSGAEGELEIG